MALAAAAVACSAAACSAAPPPPSPPLRAFYAGCARTFADGACEVGSSGLVVWTASDSPPATLSIDGADAAPDCRPAGEGQACRIAVPAAATAVALTPIEADAGGPWRLQLRPPPPPGPIEVAQAHRAAGEASAALDALQRGPIPVERGGEALSLRARLANDRGETALALDLLDRAIARHAADGRAWEERADRIMAAFLWVYQGDFAAAERARGPAPAPDDPHLDGAFNHHQSVGTAAFARGDFRAARRSVTLAVAAARRMDDPRALAFSLDLDASILSGMGRFAEAAALRSDLADTLDAATQPCDRARALNNLGVDHLRAIEEGQADPAAFGPVADDAFRAAQALLGGCPASETHLASVSENRAQLDLARGDTEGAVAHLALARRHLVSVAPTVDIALAAMEIEAQLSQARGDWAGALAGFADVEALAVSAQAPEAEWRALRGQARVLAQSTDPDRALAAYARAARVFADQSALVPAHAGRDAFLARWEQATADQVALLLRLDRPADALAAVRRFRSSYLRTWAQVDRARALTGAERVAWADLQSRYAALANAGAKLDATAWQRSAGEAEAARSARDALSREARELLDQGLAPSPIPDRPLRAPSPGELIVAFTEAGGRRWALALSDAGATAHDLGPARAPIAPEAWLAPLAALLEPTARVTLLPTGATQDLDLLALPLGGQPLIARHPVRVSLDLLDHEPGWPPLRRALITADPSGDLPAARAEADAVGRHLAAAGINARQLQGDDADRGAVLGALGEVDLLHHAGHGAWTGEPWDASLVLAHDTRVTASDVLAAGSVPRVVVLSSCEGARSAQAALSTMGLAQAFVGAGAQAVIAAERPVGDEVARVFSTTRYEGGFSSGVEVAFQQAALAARAADPGGSDWAAFRLLTP